MSGLLVLSLSLLAALVYSLFLIHGLRRRLAYQASRLATFEQFSGDWIWQQDAQFRFIDAGPATAAGDDGFAEED